MIVIREESIPILEVGEKAIYKVFDFSRRGVNEDEASDLVRFCKNVGLMELFSEINDLYAYLLGVEVIAKDLASHFKELVEPKQIFELMEALERHVSKLVREKACATCVNFKEGCSLSATERVKCSQNEKSFYTPAIPTT
ncbi:MAG: DpnII family type II restriction endonuclease [Candidatus Bathyarchaeota archaeon]